MTGDNQQDDGEEAQWIESECTTAKIRSRISRVDLRNFIIATVKPLNK